MAESPGHQLRTREEARSVNRFDVRRITGGLLAFYGVVLLVAALFTSDADIERAQGVNINLWTGLGMALVGGSLMLWAFLRPIVRPEEIEA